jgi:hypothetical protein
MTKSGNGNVPATELALVREVERWEVVAGRSRQSVEMMVTNLHN